MRRMIMPVVVAAIVSCSPKVRTILESSHPSLPEEAEVLVLQDSEVPSAAEYIGRVKIGDTGFTTRGSYAEVLALAKDAARKAGGNLLDLRVHKLPDSHSTIHRIEADIFLLEDPSSLIEGDIVMSEHPEYAMIYLYRGAAEGGYLVQYNVNLNGEFVYRCSPQSCEEVRVETPGEYLLNAKTEAGDSFPLHVELGREYYIRCSVSNGIVVGHPVFELVEGHNGRLEYAAVKEEQKSSSWESREEIIVRHWQITMHGGFAFRTSPVSKELDMDLRDHLKKMTRGLGYSVSVAYYFNSYWGIGASFDAFRSMANYKGLYDEVTNIYFAGPVFAMRYVSPGGRHTFYCMEGVGYLGYSDVMRSTPYKIRAGAPGLLSKLGYDYALTDNMAIGVSVSGVNGTATKYTATDGKNKTRTSLDPKEYEGLSNIRISAGLSFVF